MKKIQLEVYVTEDDKGWLYDSLEALAQRHSSTGRIYAYEIRWSQVPREEESKHR